VDHDDPNAKPKEVPRESPKGMHAWNPRVTPERNAADYLKVDKKAAGKLRELGFTSALVVPGAASFAAAVRSSICRMRTSTAWSSHHQSRSTSRSISIAATTAGIRTRSWARSRSCGQSFLDAGWYQAAQDAYAKKPATTERPEANASLAALAEHARRKQPAVFEAEDELDLLRV
jgi:hypothetical protein